MEAKRKGPDPISFILEIQQELVDALKMLGTEPAPYPTLKKKLDEAQRDNKLQKIIKLTGLNPFKKLIPLLPNLVPAADVTGKKENLLKRLSEVILLLEGNTNFTPLSDSLTQLKKYYESCFKDDVIEPLAWASAVGVTSFYIKGDENLSSAELASSKLLLRDTTGNRLSSEEFAFGTNRWCHFQSLHIKPMGPSSELAEIRKHNVIGSWLQMFNQRHKVFTPAIRLKLSHIKTNFSVKNKHEFERVKGMIETYGSSKNIYLTNEIKISPFVPDGVEVAILLETMSAIHNWEEALGEVALIGQLERLENINITDVDSWPKKLVEHSGCVLDERKRLPLYYFAMQKLLNNYSAKKAVDEIPNILSKISSYSFTSLLVAALACVPEDFIGTNIMLCPTDKNKTEFYFKVIDSKRAHFHAITQNGDVHYVNLDLILLKFPQMSHDADKDFLDEFTSMNALEWLMRWSGFQNQQETSGHEPYKYRPETLNDKLTAINAVQNAIRNKQGNLANKALADAAQPVVMLFYDKTKPELTDEENLGLCINQEFAACTFRKPSIEQLFTGSMTKLKELSQKHTLVDPTKGVQTTLAKLLEPYPYAPDDHSDTSLTIKEAIIHLLSSVDYADYYENENVWKKAYNHWSIKFPFLVPFEKAYTLKVNQALKSIMTGDMSYFKEKHPNRDDVFNRIKWAEITKKQSRRSQTLLVLSGDKKRFFGRKRGSTSPLKSVTTKENSSLKKSKTRSQLETVDVVYDSKTAYQILGTASKSGFEFKRTFKLVDCSVNISPFIEDFFARCQNITTLTLSNSIGVTSDIFRKMSVLTNLQHLTLNRVVVESMSIEKGPITKSLLSITMRNCKQLKKATLNLSQLESLDFSGTEGLTDEDVNAILTNSPLLKRFFCSPKKGYNLKPFLEYAYRQGRLFEPNSQSDILQSIVVKNNLHLLGVPITPKELHSLSRGLKHQKRSFRFDKVDFTGCTLPHESILEFVASHDSVNQVCCNQKLSQSAIEDMSFFGKSEQPIKKMLSLINGNIMTVFTSGEYSIWNLLTRKITDEGTLVNAGSVRDIIQLSRGGFAVITHHAFVVKESLTSGLSTPKIFTIKSEHHTASSKFQSHYRVVEVSPTCLALLTDKLELYSNHNNTYKHIHTLDVSSVSMICVGPFCQLAIIINEGNKKNELCIYTVDKNTISLKFSTAFEEKVEAIHFVDDENLVVATQSRVVELRPPNKDPRLLCQKQMPIKKFINTPTGQVMALFQDGSITILDSKDKPSNPTESAITDLTLAQDGTILFASKNKLFCYSRKTHTYELSFRESNQESFTFTCLRDKDIHSIEIKHTGANKHHWESFKVFITQFIDEAEISVTPSDGLKLAFKNSTRMKQFYDHMKRLTLNKPKYKPRLTAFFSVHAREQRRSSIGDFYEFKKPDTGRGYY